MTAGVCNDCGGSTEIGHSGCPKPPGVSKAIWEAADDDQKLLLEDEAFRAGFVWGPDGWELPRKRAGSTA